jgi:putative acetyltransferase
MHHLLELIELKEENDAILASIIRNTLAEFGANHPGTVYFDPETDHLSTVFTVPRCWYRLAKLDGEIVGGAGFYPSPGLPEDTCELVKMYLLPQARGKGIGQYLLTACIEEAKKKGYRKMYLETMPELKNAIQLYEKNGFRYLDQQSGQTGHFGCGIWMIRDLYQDS